MLLCTKCSTEKDESEFTANSSAKSRGGKDYRCRDCLRQHYLDNRERHKKSTRARKIKIAYGLEVEEYDRLVAQGCTVCGATNEETRVHMDHDHVSGKVRAPLCNGCNSAIGYAKDDPVRLRALADYVEEHAAA